MPDKDTTLEAVAACCKEKGIRNSTWATIAKEAGIDEDVLRKKYKKKSLLMLAVQGYELGKLKQAYHKEMPDASLEDTVEFIMKTRLEFAEKYYDRTVFFFSQALAGHEPWSKTLTQMVMQLSLEFVTLFEKSIREGDLDKSVDTNIAVRALVSFYMTGLVIGLRNKDFSAESAWEFIGPQVSMFLNSLKK